MRRDFQAFLADLRRTLNRELREEDVVSMIAQHLVTGPVFQALFADYDFVGSNPVSRALSRLVELLEEPRGWRTRRGTWSPSMRVCASGLSALDNAEARQRCCWNSTNAFSRWLSRGMRNAWALSTRPWKWWTSFCSPRTMRCSSTLGGG